MGIDSFHLGRHHGTLTGLEPAEVVSQIKAAIAHAGFDTAAGSGGIALQSITITLSAVTSTTVDLDGKLTVPVVSWVLELEGGLSDANTHIVEVVLEPPWPKPAEAAHLAATPGSSIDQQLILAFQTLQQTVADAAATPLPLRATSSKVTLSLEVTKDYQVKLAVPSWEHKHDGTISVEFDFAAVKAGKLSEPTN